MKLWCVSKNEKMLKIGDATQSMELAPWYFMTDVIIEQIKKDKSLIGQEVAFATTLQSGSKFITSISKSGIPPKVEVKTTETPVKTVVETTTVHKPISTGATDNGQEVKVTERLPYEEWKAKMIAEGKWKEQGDNKFDSTTSKRQTAAHASSRALIALQGTVLTPENLEELIKKTFNLYLELIG